MTRNPRFGACGKGSGPWMNSRLVSERCNGLLGFRFLKLSASWGFASNPQSGVLALGRAKTSPVDVLPPFREGFGRSDARGSSAARLGSAPIPGIPEWQASRRLLVPGRHPITRLWTTPKRPPSHNSLPQKPLIVNYTFGTGTEFQCRSSIDTGFKTQPAPG